MGLFSGDLATSSMTYTMPLVNYTETEVEMKERHEQELAKAKKEKEYIERDDLIRRERHICDFIAEDEILKNIHEAIGLIDENGNGMKTTELKKAYNSRLNEISYVMVKLKK